MRISQEKINAQMAETGQCELTAYRAVQARAILMDRRYRRRDILASNWIK